LPTGQTGAGGIAAAKHPGIRPQGWSDNQSMVTGAMFYLIGIMIA
tara:strand:- start:934 stop:1068 length:135 start_codon:yes stop_codon:yes gene_type:complete